MSEQGAAAERVFAPVDLPAPRLVVTQRAAAAGRVSPVLRRWRAAR